MSGQTVAAVAGGVVAVAAAVAAVVVTVVRMTRARADYVRAREGFERAQASADEARAASDAAMRSWSQAGDSRRTRAWWWAALPKGFCPFCGEPVDKPGCDRYDDNMAPMHVRKSRGRL